MQNVTTRRGVMAGVAAAAAGATLGSIGGAHPGHAAAAAAGRQVPGVYRYRVGAYEVTAINDGQLTMPVKPLIPNATVEEIDAALAAAHLPPGQATPAFNPIVVNTGAKLILIDSGFGQHAGPTLGFLPVNLAAAGIDAKAIDAVLISHLHPDHIGGLRTADGALTFPNAEIMVPARDWAFWIEDGNMAKLRDRLPEGMVKNHFRIAAKIFDGLGDEVTRYEWGKEVAPGITTIDASGDTPGHTAFIVASGAARILVQGDVANQPELFLRNPDWHNIFENDPVAAAATRHRIYDMAAAENMLIAGYHFPFPAAGYVEKDGPRYRLVPMTWQPVI